MTANVKQEKVVSLRDEASSFSCLLVAVCSLKKMRQAMAEFIGNPDLTGKLCDCCHCCGKHCICSQDCFDYGAGFELAEEGEECITCEKERKARLNQNEQIVS